MFMKLMFNSSEMILEDNVMADFFEKMKEGFNRGIATVSTGSKTMIEKNKINIAIKFLEEEKCRFTEKLGNRIYTFCSINSGVDIPFKEIEDLYDEILRTDEKIEKQKAKLINLNKNL